VSEVRVGALFRCSLEPELLRSYARRVEGLGYDELWIVEDCFYAGGIASAATALAATERITVGLGILPAVLRNPAATAMEVAALARLFPGRVVPGLGHGVAAWMRQVGALPPSQLAALGETITTVRALLAGQTVTLYGAHVHLDDVRLDHPPRITPPVLAGVRGPRSLRLSGRVADGTILTELSSPGYVRWAREQIDAGRAEAARTDPHRVIVYALLGVGAAGRQAVHLALAHSLQQGSPPQLGPAEADGAAALATVAANARDGDAGALTDEFLDAWVDRLAVTGEPGDCARAVQAFGQAGANTVVLVPPSDPGIAIDQLEQAAPSSTNHRR
jgi:5,10-methylenetetrahydromethanopterin reductase